MVYSREGGSITRKWEVVLLTGGYYIKSINESLCLSLSFFFSQEGYLTKPDLKNFLGKNCIVLVREIWELDFIFICYGGINSKLLSKENWTWSNG